MPSKKRIGVIMHMTAGYLHDVLGGIARATSAKTDWTIRVAGLFDDWIPRLYTWKPHGILTCIVSNELKRLYLECGVPVVSFTGSYPDGGLPTVHVDDQMIGQIAAEHFINMNLKHFAVWAGHDAPFTVDRIEGFHKTLKSSGVTESHYHPEPETIGSRWQKRDRVLAQWLRKLPKPVGLFVTQDSQAYYITEIAKEAGLDVPNDIALLGVDNDPLTCRLTDPPLSSISLPAVQVGARAVQMLENMLGGQSISHTPILLKPTGIVERGSTDMLAIEDAEMANAVRYIRENATGGITVADVLRHIPIARRSFEWRFRKMFNRSPGEEIRRVQIEKARSLLLDTKKTMPEIAALSGFCDSEYMARIFKKQMGCPPTKYRKENNSL